MNLSQIDIDNLLTDLSSNDAEKRAKAERFYNENKAELLPQLIEHLDKLMATMQHRKKQVNWIYLVPLSGIPLYALVVTKFLSPIVFLLGALFSVMWFIGVGFMVVAIKRSKPSSDYKHLLEFIGKLESPRFVGHMLDLMQENNRDIDEIIAPIFYHQLRMLKHTDALLLNEKQRRYLCLLLVRYGTRTYENFNGGKALAILKALEQIGNMKAYATVREVAMTGGSEVVREAAEDCLIYIKVRREMMEPQHTLLRASQSTGGQDELLRAANSNADTQAETLLRVPTEE